MPHYTAPDYFSLTAYALALFYGIGMAVFLLRQDKATKGSSYLIRQEGEVMQFRRPHAASRSMMVIAGYVALMELAIVIAYRHISLTPEHILIVSFFFLDTPLFLAFLVYLAGPNDIFLDGNRRTYEWTTGWLWKPTTRFGSFDDIKGISVSRRYGVMLLMNKRSFPYSSIGLSNSGTSAAAQTLAEDVSREFGFLIVPYPK